MIPVLWIAQVYPRHAADLFGGFLHRLARELPGRGFRPVVLAPGDGTAAAREIVDGVEVVRFPATAARRAGLTYSGEMHRAALRSPLAFLRFLRAFRAAAAAEAARVGPAVVHAHWWFPGGWVAAPLAGDRPLVVSLHGTDVRLLAKWPPARPLARGVLRSSARVLPVSEYLRATMDALVPDGGERVVLPMPADAACFRPGDAPAGARPPVFVVAARLTAQKRVDLAIEAAARAARSAPEEDVRLEVAGDGPERERLERRAEELGIADRVTFHGALAAPRLAERFRAARGVVLCSEREGYGLTLVEAALSGTPGIGVRSGAIPELVEPERTGLLADAGDAGGLAEAMLRLVRDPEAASRWGRAAAEAAAGRAAAPLADRLAAVYARIARPGAALDAPEGAL